MYMRESSLDGKEAYVKVNAESEPVKAKLKKEREGINTYFEEPREDIIPGEIAVFYNWSGNIMGSAHIEHGLP